MNEIQRAKKIVKILNKIYPNIFDINDEQVYDRILSVAVLEHLTDLPKVIEKVKEEIQELIESVEKNSNKIHEAADVMYHLFVYLEANGIKIEDVIEELAKRKK